MQCVCEVVLGCIILGDVNIEVSKEDAVFVCSIYL